MNESWRQAEADAHEAKAEALQLATDALDGLDGAVDAILNTQVALLVQALEVERERQMRAATLARKGIGD